MCRYGRHPTRQTKAASIRVPARVSSVVIAAARLSGRTMATSTRLRLAFGEHYGAGEQGMAFILHPLTT